MKIYLASSWRNAFYRTVYDKLVMLGHDVYDFKENGFTWEKAFEEVGMPYNPKTPESGKFLRVLEDSSTAKEGYQRDLAAIFECELLIQLQPCGVSAAIELGLAVGLGKRTAVLAPAIRDYDLMLRVSDNIFMNWDRLEEWLQGL